MPFRWALKPSCFAVVFVDHQPGERKTIVRTFLLSLILASGWSSVRTFVTCDYAWAAYARFPQFIDLCALVTRDSYVAPLKQRTTRGETGAAAKQNKRIVCDKKPRGENEVHSPVASEILKSICLSNQSVNWCQSIERNTHTIWCVSFREVSTCRWNRKKQKILSWLFSSSLSTTSV